ncbi:glycoside hydrolase [Roridomyces roridus]|uniref:glucan endo-1,3-beta-D-glucosidase n=1 Tax=Roridomyces roridus TaxID=1738132 RepID=A0AAD7C4W9_9AGAR|nr:glycoside hydrolase [Roridomyces roridus]
MSAYQTTQYQSVGDTGNNYNTNNYGGNNYGDNNYGGNSSDNWNYNNTYNTALNAQTGRSRRSKWIVIGSVVGIIALIAIGVGVGVSVANSHKSSKSSNLSSNSKSSNSGSSNSSVTQTDPSDPSTFVRNSSWTQAFYGIAYTPEGSQLPNCGNSLEQVITDIQLMSQLTKRIRLYGADCNQSALVLEAIKQTKVDMTVFLANYPIPTDGGAAYVRQRDLIQSALQTYGTDHVGGITVGNEYILDYLSDNGGSTLDPNGPVGNQGAALLLPNITDTINMVKGMGLNIPVGNSDAGSYFNNEVLAAVDYGMANVHPWFAAESVQDGANWTETFFSTTNVAAASALSNNPTMYIAETGWPTNSSTAAAESDGPSNASVANLQIFLDTFVCAANSAGTKYFFFEYFDEVWKDIQFGGVEGYWGLFNADRTIKAINIPTCTAP